MTMIELTALVTAKFMLPSETVLEISEYAGVDHPDAAKLLAALTAEDCLTSTGLIAPSKKIASIKKLRELVVSGRENFNGENCGLVQAKTAIEDYSHFLTYVRRHGFPLMGGNDKEFSWLKA